MKNPIGFLILVFVVFVSCNETKTAETSKVEGTKKVGASKPAFIGDEKAITIATEVLAAVGGQAGWDATNLLQWNFFGSRKHIWNKQTGDLIIKGIRDTFESRINLNTLTGSVNLKGQKLTHPDSLEKYILKARDMWRNDSYWIFLPFKLQEPGVRLKYLGIEDLNDISGCEKLEMTFESVGKTPENKYVLWVDPSTKRIIQWDFYPKASDEKPRFVSPWTNYQQYGKIWLSDQRGGDYLISEIEVGPHLVEHFK